MAQLNNLLVTGASKFLNKIIGDISGDAATVNGHSVNSDVPANAGFLPSVSSADNGKFLCVDNGTWAAVTVPNANGASF